jgi:hypothetical protein
MYLRTTKRRNGDGTEAIYYQLAENVWDRERGSAVAKVIYNLACVRYGAEIADAPAPMSQAILLRR